MVEGDVEVIRNLYLSRFDIKQMHKAYTLLKNFLIFIERGKKA